MIFRTFESFLNPKSLAPRCPRSTYAIDVSVPQNLEEQPKILYSCQSGSPDVIIETLPIRPSHD
jgi:hypothetical protein